MLLSLHNIGGNIKRELPVTSHLHSRAELHVFGGSSFHSLLPLTKMCPDLSTIPSRRLFPSLPAPTCNARHFPLTPTPSCISQTAHLHIYFKTLGIKPFHQDVFRYTRDQLLLDFGNISQLVSKGHQQRVQEARTEASSGQARHR